MNPFDYFRFRYYEKWLGGITQFFLDKGYISEDELASWQGDLSAALAGLSLPLIGREAVQDAADLADRLPMGGLEGHPRERRRSTDGQRSACRLDRVVARSAAARVEGCNAIGEAARQLEKRLAGLPAQLIEADLRPFGQMIVERNDVQRTHTGQDVTGHLVHVQSKGSLARRAEYHRCPGNQM
jgi:Nitrile hydratase beta subunit